MVGLGLGRNEAIIGEDYVKGFPFDYPGLERSMDAECDESCYFGICWSQHSILSAISMESEA